MERKEQIRRCPLFGGMAEQEVHLLLAEMKASGQEFQKEEILIHEGKKIRTFGILLSGKLLVMKEEYSGSTAIVAQIFPGELFAEAFAAGEAEATVTVMASEPSEVLWINYANMMNACPESMAQKQMMRNMMKILAKKNLFLTGRISHLSRRTLKEKVLSYLSEEAKKAGSKSFEIPFDRQGLADYLAADRSALSAVLGKLKKEKILDFHKNYFILRQKGKQFEEWGTEHDD